MTRGRVVLAMHRHANALDLNLFLIRLLLSQFFLLIIANGQSRQFYRPVVGTRADLNKVESVLVFELSSENANVRSFITDQAHLGW